MERKETLRPPAQLRVIDAPSALAVSGMYPHFDPLPARSQAGLLLEAEAWAPIYAIATELKVSFVEPLHGKVCEALGVLKELGGQQAEVEDGLAVDAFSFTLLDALSQEIGMTDDRRSHLLQLVAAQIFFSPRNPSITSREFFWNFLNDLSAKYRAQQGSSGTTLKLATVLDHFLGHYRLNGPENADVISGIHRIVVPLIQATRKLLREKAPLLAV